MKEIVKDILIAIVLALVITQFDRTSFSKERSMEPTLHENDYLFISCQAYTFGEPEYGDIIVFRSDVKDDKGRNKRLIKRVIGLPGDTIKVSDDKVYRNGENIYEEYIREQDVIPGEIEVTVPEDELFVMGDNRRVSIDSRYEDVGCVRIDDVIGVAFFRIYPFGQMTRF